MALSEKMKEKLDFVLKQLSEEGHTVWGFIVSSSADELQTFSNESDSIDAFLANSREALRALDEVHDSKKNEA